MKKLVILMSVIVSVCVANAAAFSWKSTGTSTKGVIYAGNASTKLSTAADTYTAYLFDAAVISQSDLLTGLRNGTEITGFTKVDSTTLTAASKITSKPFAYGDVEDIGLTFNFYYAIINNDNVFISSSLPGFALENGTTALDFGAINEETQLTFAGVDTAYSAGGWYSTAPIPEPTSGLLLLIGVAGLALRRKRA